MPHLFWRVPPYFSKRFASNMLLDAVQSRQYGDMATQESRHATAQMLPAAGQARRAAKVWQTVGVLVQNPTATCQDPSQG